MKLSGFREPVPLSDGGGSEEEGVESGGVYGQAAGAARAAGDWCIGHDGYGLC